MKWFLKKELKEKNTADEMLDENQIKNIAVFPISIPLVAGPSALTLSVLSQKLLITVFWIFIKKFFLLIILFMTSLIILFSNYIIMLLNQTFIKILHKIFGINIRRFIS